MKKFVTLFCSFFCLTFYAFGGTKTPVSTSIEWGNANHWSPSGVPANGDEVIIPEGYVVTVKSKVYKTSTPDIFITISGTLQFEPSGTLDLGINSTVHLTTSSAQLRSNATGSEILLIGGEIKYRGSDGTPVINGPAYTSINTPPAPGGFQPTPLPVKLTHFSAHLRNGAVGLSWRTVMEENARHFVVERSPDAIHWQPLATVPTRGANTTYSYIDAAPLATGFYRLKMVDWDERVEYTPVARVTGAATVALQLGPNPASSHLNILLAYPGSQLLQLQVLTASGQVVKQLSATSTGYTRLSVAGLPRGQYYLLVKDATLLVETRVFIVN